MTSEWTETQFSSIAENREKKLLRTSKSGHNFEVYGFNFDNQSSVFPRSGISSYSLGG